MSDAMPDSIQPIASATERDRADFAAFLRDTGLSADWVDAISTNQHDQVPMPNGWCACVAPSPIHGKGLFATHPIQEGEAIAPARVGGGRTPAGRYANHGAYPNAEGVPNGADVDLVALRPIAPGEEITLDYRAAIRANMPLAVAARRELMTGLLASLMAHGDRNPPAVNHTFCNGMYMRELFIPKGMVLMGKIHKVPCLNICSSGDIEVATERGMVRAGAGYTVVSPAFSQKLGYAYADTVWVNVFRTDLTEIDAVERELFLSDADMVAMLDPAGRHFTEPLHSRGQQ
jgi:hypothetical protein